MQKPPLGDVALEFKPAVRTERALLMLGVTALFLFAGLPDDARAQHSSSAAVYCEQYARDAAKRSTRGGALGGMARGALGGALIGSVWNNDPGKGAGIGAVTGGIARGAQANQTYERYYRSCMSGQ